jgi:hypothetical protein
MFEMSLRYLQEILKKISPANICCYFITGTGRCGTMLVSRALSLGSNSECSHERSVTTSIMKEAYYSGDYLKLFGEINKNIVPAVAKSNLNGKIYGECSAHLYFLFEELYRRFGKRTRLGLLVRRPDEFVRSALARGFFNPEHPNALEHLRPAPTSLIGRQWDIMEPYEKCLWYWDLVNAKVMSAFRNIPKEHWKVIRMEDLNAAYVLCLIDFFGIKRANKEGIEKLMIRRVNATPGEAGASEINPWSIRMTFPKVHDWTTDYRATARKRLGDLAYELYPELEELLGRRC